MQVLLQNMYNRVKKQFYLTRYPWLVLPKKCTQVEGWGKNSTSDTVRVLIEGCLYRNVQKIGNNTSY